MHRIAACATWRKTGAVDDGGRCIVFRG